MEFSNILLAPRVIVPLRYYFSRYSQGSAFVWNEDEKKRTMDIGETFDFNKVAVQEKPRVLVGVGPYNIAKVGLTDNLAEAQPLNETLGRRDFTNFLLYSGNIQVFVEARNKGTCELLADMVSHFIAWTRPILCDSEGWKEFGLPMNISECAMVPNEDPETPKFQIQMNVPWVKEEHWRVRNDGAAIKAILTTITVQ